MKQSALPPPSHSTQDSKALYAYCTIHLVSLLQPFFTLPPFEENNSLPCTSDQWLRAGPERVIEEATNDSSPLQANDNSSESLIWSALSYGGRLGTSNAELFYVIFEIFSVSMFSIPTPHRPTHICTPGPRASH